MKLQTLEDLFLHELKDLYSAENQLVKALPKMAKAATNPELKAGFEEHLEQTKGHVQRLTKIGEQLGKELTGHTCKAMEGLVEEGAEMIDEDAEESVRDAGLIGAAQRVEHYEIAGYDTARALATRLGHDDFADLLEETLNERETDAKLTELAESAVNSDAATKDKESDEDKAKEAQKLFPAELKAGVRKANAALRLRRSSTASSKVPSL